MLGLSNTVSGDSKHMANKYSLSFDGANDYVECNRLANDIVPGAFSIACWVKVDTTTSTRTIFCAKNDDNNKITLQYHGSGAEIRFNAKYNSSAKVCNGGTDFDGDGNWYHIVGTVDFENTEVKLYINNNLKETVSTLSEFAGTISVVDIGQNTAGSAYFIGNIDEVAVWKNVLTADDVTSLFNGGKPFDFGQVQPSNLIANYHFDEGSGVYAEDSSSGDNNGAITNGARHSIDLPLR